MYKTYVPLHNHTRRGSNFDGDIDIKKFVEFSLAQGLPAVCITDHGSMSAAYELFTACNYKETGLKHLIGCELYVKESDGSKTPKGKDYYHLTAIAINLAGYKNLCRLSTLGNVEGRHGRSSKPCVTNEQIFAHSEGIVILSGCISSELNQSLDTENEPRAKKWIIKYKAVFKDKLFLELHCHHGIKKSWPTNAKKIVELGNKFGVKRIITNDAHFLRQEDWFSQTLCLAVGMKGGANLGSQKLEDFTYTGEEYIKTRDEIFSHFLDNSGLGAEEIDNALDATLEVADMFEYYSLNNVVKPIVFCDNAKEVFRKKCIRGMYDRYPYISEDDPKWERLDYEMGVITEFNFPDYFLIVEDFCRYARDKGYKVGKGRGSAAGSLVAYCLEITDIDPIRHGLIFERFLNPGRKSLPDIDTDVDGEGKDAIIEHLRQRWGRYSAASIGTITKSAAGSSLADAYRISNLNTGRATQLSKKYFKTVRGIPPKIKELLADEKSEFYKFYLSIDAEEKAAIDMAANLIEGRERQAGVHAGGVAISSELYDYVPLTWDGTEQKIVTVFDKDELENMGVIKFDILGLTNLGQELEIERLLREAAIPIPHIDELGDYPEIYQMLRSGSAGTFGVFQMSEGVPTKLLKEIEAKCFEDLSAVNALNRPGPLDSGSDRVYVRNRLEGTPPIQPDVDRILADTYGIMLYQEEIMLIAQHVGGYTLGEADELRKIIGKKLLAKMPAQESKFVGGGLAKGIEPTLLANLWNEIKAAGAYSFNKSHTYAYGYQAIISAFYKCYYPAQFWAAGITVNNTKFEKSSEYISQAKSRFKILPPTIHYPRAKCWVWTSGNEAQIVLGLGNIKGIGVNAAIAIEQNAPYTGLLDFVLRSGVGKATVIELNSLGFFGGIFIDAEIEALYRKITSFKTKIKKIANANLSVGEEKIVPNFTETELRAYLQEKKFTITPPRAKTERDIKTVIESEMALVGTVISVDPFVGLPDFNGENRLTGIVISKKVIVTKKGQSMAFLTVQDRHGENYDVTLLPNRFDMYHQYIDDAIANFIPVFIEVSWNDYNGKRSCIADFICSLGNLNQRLATLQPYAGGGFSIETPEWIFGAVVESRVLPSKQEESSVMLTVVKTDGSIHDVWFRQRSVLYSVNLEFPVLLRVKYGKVYQGKVQIDGLEISNSVLVSLGSDWA
ncbi:MAG: DNA polymerase III subunit alpha [Nostoc sp.]|uniref:DNA polymerase III subunit alpha n=1 Tax=Nostoc sp. TaxID=1180 RepID=UPI002FEF4753